MKHSTRSRYFEAAKRDQLRIMELEGETFGIGTAEEIAQQRADGTLPVGATDRPIEWRDIV